MSGRAIVERYVRPLRAGETRNRNSLSRPTPKQANANARVCRENSSCKHGKMQPAKIACFLIPSPIHHEAFLASPSDAWFPRPQHGLGQLRKYFWYWHGRPQSSVFTTLPSPERCLWFALIPGWPERARPISQCVSASRKCAAEGCAQFINEFTIR